MHTTESDSALGCTLWSHTPRYDAHDRAFLSSGMHTREFLKNLNIFVKSKKKLKKTLACLSGSKMGKGQKSSDTLPLSGPLFKCLWELAFPTLLAQTQKNSLICTLYSTHCIFKVADSNLSTVFGKIP